MLALQPIKIDREDHFYIADKKHEQLQEKHMFGKLKEIMKEYELKYVMRTTIEINSFAQITQNYLRKKSNRYIHSYQLGEIRSNNLKIESQNLSPISKPPSNIASGNLCDSSNPGGEIAPIVEVIDDVKLISREITRGSSITCQVQL